MIVRIAGEGQFRVPQEQLGALNDLDNQAVTAVEAGDEKGFQVLLAEMTTLVRSHGEAVPEDELASSDVILPPPDTTLEEARGEFAGEGLIPG